MTTVLGETLFWISLGLLFYIYIGYFALIWIVSRFFPPRTYKPAAELPSVSFIIAAYNEEEVIAAKVANCLSRDYPGELVEVLVGSDGSTDGTGAILTGINDPRVDATLFEGRHGKNWVVNNLVQKSRGEILVFTDANIMFDPPALRHLVAPFQDEKVGGVIGTLRLITGEKEHTGTPEQTYWSLENSLRSCETRIGTTFGLTGAIYAVRRELFRELPGTAVVEDDTYIVNAVLMQGYSVVNADNATAYERITDNIFAEMKRRIRICARNLNGIRFYRTLLHPKNGYVALGLVSHKILRWLAPFPLVALFITTWLLAGDPFFSWMLALQLLFITCALAGILLNLLKTKIKFLTYCAYFLVINAGLFLGFFKFLLRLQKPFWDDTNRP